MTRMVQSVKIIGLKGRGSPFVTRGGEKMSYMRQIGYLVREALNEHPEKKPLLLHELNISELDLQKLCVGRLFLSLKEQSVITHVLGISMEDMLSEDTARRKGLYQNVVHCMTPFSNRENLDQILDLFDAYIDAKEALGV